jgi:hypothetical protein
MRILRSPVRMPILFALVLLGGVFALALHTLANRPAHAAAPATAPAVEKWEYLELLRTTARNSDERYELSAPTTFNSFPSLKNLMTHFKYKVTRPGVENDLNVADLLNCLGAQGWELVSTTMMYDNTTALRRESWTFKRRAS